MAALQNPNTNEVIIDHFDFNPVKVYSDLDSQTPSKLYSKELYDRICKVLNFRKIMLAIWSEVHTEANRKGSTSATLIGELENLSKDSENNISNLGLTPIDDRKSTSKKTGSGPRHFTFDFDDAPIIDRRSRADSGDSIEELKILGNQVVEEKEKPQEKKPSCNEPALLKISPAVLRDLNLLRKKSFGSRLELRLLIYIIFLLSQVCILTAQAFVLLFEWVPLLHYLFPKTRFQANFRLKSSLKAFAKIEEISLNQGRRLTELVHGIRYVLNNLMFPLLDFCLGLAVFFGMTVYSEEIRYGLTWLLNHSSPSRLKGHLYNLTDIPLGIKVCHIYSGIISKLTQVLFMFQ